MFFFVAFFWGVEFIYEEKIRTFCLESMGKNVGFEEVLLFPLC